MLVDHGRFGGLYQSGFGCHGIGCHIFGLGEFKQGAFGGDILLE